MAGLRRIAALRNLPPQSQPCSSKAVKRLRLALAAPAAFARQGVTNVSLGRAFAAVLGVTAIGAPAGAAVRTGGDNPPVVAGSPLQTAIVEGRAWTVEGRFGSLYDTNFRRTITPESAVRLSPLVHVGAGLPIGRQQIFIGADFGRDIVVNQPLFTRNRFAIGGGVEWRLGTRCSGVVGGELLKRMVMVDEQAELTTTVQTTEVVAGSVGCTTATGLGFGGSFVKSSLTNDTVEREPFDLRSTVFAPNISYGTPAIGQFSLTATINNTKYPNRLALTPDGLFEEGIRLFQGRIGYQRSLGSRLQVAVGLSFLKTQPIPQAVISIINNQPVFAPRESFSGGGYDGSITYNPSTRITVNVVASRNVNASANIGAQFVIRNAYGADIGYRIGPSLNFGIGGVISRNQYKDTFVTPGVVPRTSDNNKRAYASLDYSPVPLYSIGVEVAHQLRRSDVPEFNFDSTTARLNLRVKFGRG